MLMADNPPRERWLFNSGSRESSISTSAGRRPARRAGTSFHPYGSARPNRSGRLHRRSRRLGGCETDRGRCLHDVTLLEQSSRLIEVVRVVASPPTDFENARPCRQSANRLGAPQSAIPGFAGAPDVPAHELELTG